MVSFLEISPEQIQRLDEHLLVELLRRLSKAEMLKNEIPLRDVNVPTQIHIPDGGEDGRVSWSGGLNETDYLPSRHTIFQCKKSDPGPTGCKKETWKKGTGTTDHPAELNEALDEALAASGSYIIVTGSAVVGTKVTDRISKIEEGIRDAGKNPDLLSSIRIYDANKLSDWTSTHPAIALWLNSILQEVDLGGLQSFELWSQDGDISQVAFQTSEEPRFRLTGNTARNLISELGIDQKTINFEQLQAVIEHFFASGGKSVRVVGPSGFGKTRVVHELFSRTNDTCPTLDSSSVVFCDFEDVSQRLGSLALNLVSSGAESILIVDDCPDNLHNDLFKKAQRNGSKVRLITLDVETRSQGVFGNLVIELLPASDELINGIVEGSPYSNAKNDVGFIRELAQGFPRMALVAAEAAENGDTELVSVDALVNRIVWGKEQEDAEALRALQFLSLFTFVGVEGDRQFELEQLASFMETPTKDIFRDLAAFRDRGVVGRVGDFAEARPQPLAVRLAVQLLDTSPEGELIRLFERVGTDLRFRLLSRLRWLSFDHRVAGLALSIVETLIPSIDALNTDEGSKFMDRLVHLEPDLAIATLEGFLSHLSIDELLEFRGGRRNTVWALEKLVFRNDSFEPAANLLLKLAAAENENWGNNAHAQFVGLFQLHLSGTEVEPARRLEILDAGLKDEDSRIRSVCIDALGRMLQTGHFTRSGGNERIGADPALQDWQPEIYKDVFEFYNAAIDRLTDIALEANVESYEKATSHLGSNIRGLLSYPNIFDNLRKQVTRVFERNPAWTEPIKSINRWFFFDSKEAPADYVIQVREWYDELFPDSKVDQILLLSEGWPGDFHDIEVPYDPQNDTDHEYAITCIREAVSTLSRDAKDNSELVGKIVRGEFNSGWALGYALANHVEDPEALMELACEALRLPEETVICLKTFCGIISGSFDQSRDVGMANLEIALSTPELEAYAITLISAAQMDAEIASRVAQLVTDGLCDPRHAATLSCGRGFDDYDFETILPLADAIKQTGPLGIWSALDLVYMYRYGQPESSVEKASYLKELCSCPDLFSVEAIGVMDAHHWEKSIEKLVISNQVDGAFVEAICDRSLELATEAEHNVQLKMDDAAYKVLLLCVQYDPAVVWNRVLAAFEHADALTKWRLHNLLKGSDRTPGQAGVLNDIPAEIYLKWIGEKPNERLEFVLEWIELVEQDEESRLFWTSQFISLIETYASDVSQLEAVYCRLHSGVSWGPFSARLKPLVPLFQSLRNSKNPTVRKWSSECVRSLTISIEQEERREANREAELQG
ncbi:hypothetical protein [Roseovarius sp. MMSF_3281]|uniref:hypothetical protein n=1 Tax=Roseovarius sp. MMSF_3281 TaxID=3046694 RepID=UPI0027400517|nr:hypothetical protein [Roseovarius sp. MMSF_3281]